MLNTSKTAAGFAAAAALFALSSASIPTTAFAADTVHCFGVNSCKGMSDCKSGNHDCKGMNNCKGQGFKAESAKACTAAGGTTTEPSK
jgi:uncharacterized membrane protein